MRPASRLSSFAWLIIPISAVLFVSWLNHVRIQRVKFVSAIAAEEAVVDATSPTGYAGGRRWLIVPEHNNPSYQWMAETQQMLARHEWRVRHIDYENAPAGREVFTASPYRWWLGLLAWVDHAVSGRSPGLAVEHAALSAEPLLQFLLLVGATIFVARQFGALAAAGLSLGLVTIFPLAAAYLPGVPDDHGLTLALALASVLLLLAGAREEAVSGARGRWFFLAGVAGGAGLWISAAEQTPVIGGIALGGILAAWVARTKPAPAAADEPLPWREWALGGAATSLFAYLAEFYPGHLDFRLQVNHPLYALAWLGLGEILTWFAGWMRRGKLFGALREIGGLGLALAAVAALPVALVRSGTLTTFAGDFLAERLTNLPDGVSAPNLWAWLVRDGVTRPFAAAVLPLLLLVPVLWLLGRRTTQPRRRAFLALAVGPVLVALALAVAQLRGWNLLDGMLLALFVAVLATAVPAARAAWSVFAALALGSGLLALLPAPATGGDDFKFTRAEVEGLYERAVAHWIADHVGAEGATVLVPPYRTSSFCFYGGLRGLGTPNWENREGLQATFRIATATRPNETQALVAERGVTHIVLPSWDTDLDDFARLGLKRPEGSFIYALEHWVPFNWLRALPYQLPAVGGFEGQSVMVLEVTDETDPATHRGRLVEYFIEMHQLDIAIRASEALRRYPADLGALVALAQVEKAEGNEAGFANDFNALVANLTGGFERPLPWDRRVSLAVVLALGQRGDLARAQVERCLAQIDETKIRSLTTGSLYHLLVLGRAYGQPITDPRLRELATRLLPAELRERLH